MIDKLGISKEEVLTIGDNVNDIEMIKNAKTGVVVSNSAEYVKEIADDVVSNNDEHGVSEAIEKYITSLLQ